MTERVDLGEVDTPEGILMILDPGLARFWRHDGDPASPRRTDLKALDLQIVGADAVAAGRAFDREFDPRYLFDCTDPQAAKTAFDAFAHEHRYDARAEVLARRVPHTERVASAIACGSGLGVVNYNSYWAVAASGLPPDRSHRIVGELMPPGEFAGRFRQIDVVVDNDRPIAHWQRAAGVMVEHGQLMFAGLEALGRFRMWEPLDGLADFVFWGRDAEKLARESGAVEFGDGQYGWKDVADGEIGRYAQPVQNRIKESKLAVGVDYRPHCNLERLNAQIRSSNDDVGSLLLSGARVTGCSNRWGDGIFDVSRAVDTDGRVVRVRVELATDARLRQFRRLRLRSLAAIVSRHVLDGGELIRFTERGESDNAGDSGWIFLAGTEDDAFMDDSDNFAIVSLQSILERFPELEETLEAPVGSRFRREEARFVADDDG